MKSLIIGSNGQLGRALEATLPDSMGLVAPAEAECDLTNPVHLEHWLSSAKPNFVFNAAAYTAVDAAEQNSSTSQLVNATAVGHLAQITQKHNAQLIHISTDFVFDGEASHPYRPEDRTNPLSVYGRTKLEGEQLASQAAPDTLIVRTAWVYAEIGKNFPLTMLRLMKEQPEIKVVADQIGTPTYVRNLAQALWSLTEKRASGIFHFTDLGVASWYDFAVAIAEEAADLGLLSQIPRIIPIASSEYPTPARRPGFSVLDKSKTIATLGDQGQHWREALRDMMGRLKENG